MKLILPYPPTINHYYKNNGRGGKIISDKGILYRWQVYEIFRAMKVPGFGKQKLRADWIQFLPDKRERDFDNILKPMFDALQLAGVFHKDAQVYTGSFRKVEEKPGRIILMLQAYVDDGLRDFDD
jgi:crossover junction endodeoxyribonuclease RusA